MTQDIKENKIGGRINKILLFKTPKPLGYSSTMVSNFGKLEHLLRGRVIIGANSTQFCIPFTISII